MIHLEIMFIGLISFSPLADGSMVAILTKELKPHPPHVPIIRQIEGSCEGDGCVYFSTFQDVGELLDEISEHYKPVLDTGRVASSLTHIASQKRRKLWWLPLKSDIRIAELADVPMVFPGSQPVSEDNPVITWVPSVGRLALGPAKLCSACMPGAKGETCHARSRFLLDGGYFAPCHFLHTASDGVNHLEKLLLYDVGGVKQVIANGTRMTAMIDGDSLIIEANRYADGGSASARASLKPGDDHRITLVILNEALPIIGHADDPPPSMPHFLAFYKNLSPYTSVMASIGKKKVPLLTNEHVYGEPGRCETRIDEITSAVQPLFSLLSGSLTYAFPHSASECDTATIP